MTRSLFWTVTLTLAVALLTLPALAGDGEAGRVAVGQEAPDFTLPAASGGEHTLSALRGEKNVILLFFRGSW